MDSLISRLKDKLDVLRLEKRYAKRNHRAAYKGSAIYENGEYKPGKGDKKVTVCEVGDELKRRMK